MKKTLLFLLVLASAAFLNACSDDLTQDTSSPASEVQEVEHISVSLPIMEIEYDDMADTRSAVSYENNTFEFVWTEGDVLGVFPNKGAQVDFPIEGEYVGQNTANFDGGGWLLRTGYSYSVYYPYDFYNRNKEAIPMNLTGQTQKKANDITHLNSFNYMTSEKSVVASGPYLEFKMAYVSRVFLMRFTLPVDAVLKEIRLKSDNLYFITKANLDITNDKPEERITPVIESNTATLKLNDISVKKDEQNLFYLWVLPRNYSESTVTAEIVTSTDDVYETTLIQPGASIANLFNGNPVKGFTRSYKVDPKYPTRSLITLKGSESSKVVDAMKSLKAAWGSPAALNWPASPTSVDDYASATGVTVEGGKITKIELSGKGLSGTLPECIGDLKDLTVLDLSNNSLSGTIPESIGNLTNLTTLDLSSNNFSSYKPSAAPQLASTESTSSLAPTLATAFPTTIGNLTKLMMLDLSGNKLSGEIPSSVGNLKQLQVLVLSDNDITGGLPTFIAVLPLVVLDLSNNEFTGDFVKWFFEELPVIPTLKELKLEGNNLTGEVTEEMQESERWQNLGDNVAVSEQQGGSIEVEGQVTDLNNPSATIESFSETEYDW